MTHFIQHIETAIGTLEIKASEIGICSISLLSNSDQHEENMNDHTRQCAQQLHEYFEGKRKEFDVPLDWTKASEFYIKVWRELLTMPYGSCITYKDIAVRLNNLKAIRAVGQANGRNPIPIIVPCHRVIGSNGDLTGFALGLDVKKKLLALENPLERGLQSSLF